jgi:tetratricopeptide (TPR) repeat protein
MSRIVGFGAERIKLPPTSSREEVIEQRMGMLARCLNMRTTVAFVGAGCSRPFGYPDWNGFARDAVANMYAVLASRTETKYTAVAARFAQMVARANGTQPPSSDDLLAALGYCQKISRELAEDGCGDPYEEFLKKTFNGTSIHRPIDDDLNPYVALLELPIYRIITTNYDQEIEEALGSTSSPEERKRYGLDGGGDKAKRLSFTQTEDYINQLSEFPFERREKPAMVFHCHGRHDEPDSLVATERDYQRWYLRNDAEGRAFRQNINLLFGSNPIFFIGFSMRDGDLLHALRILNADEPSNRRSPSRSLFALLESGDPLSDLARDESLLDRYNVHVIPYDSPPGAARGTATTEEWGRALCRKLTEIHRRSLEIREQFFQKPILRKVVVPTHPPAPYLHYAIQRPTDNDLAPERKASDIDRLTELFGRKENKSIVVVLGYGGSGKSWRVLDFIDHVRRNPSHFGFEGIFFWSSYYADDWLTGVDRALVYFGSEPTARKTRPQRFADCLKRNYLIVFDGFERLLRDNGSGTEGTPASRAVVQLLDAARNGNSKVILTTRLMPDILKDDDRVGRFALRRTTTEELEKGHVFGSLVGQSKLSSDDLSTICSLCDGHSYALALAAAYLNGGGGAAIPERMKKLRQKLSDVSPAHRLTTMIRIAVRDVRELVGESPEALLERIAIFMSPITEEMLKVSAGEAPSQREIEALLDARLLFRVSADPDTADAPGGYTVHPTVRSVMFQHTASDDRDSIPNFTLPGFTSGSTPVHPGSRESVKQVKRVFKAMYTAAEKALDEGNPDLARHLCRGAFGVIRSRMEVNSVPRWTTYDDYLDTYEIPLANLVKRVAPSMWDYMDRSHLPTKERNDGPLFADELAWLWNDIALAFYAQGSMADAHAVFELGYEIDRVTDSYEDGGQYLVQSRLHMAAAFLETGRLDTASEYLADTEKSNRSFRDEEYAGRIAGYKALLAHLRGNFDEAGSLYEAAEEILRRQGRNLRGRSIFAQHHADLKVAIGDLDAAASLIRTSRALAEEGKHADLVAYARNSEGHLLWKLEKYREAQLQYDASLAQARKTGIRRLEADVLCELARLAFSLGDWENARSRAVASLMIANELWLGLRCTHALVILGKAMIEMQNPKLGRAYLHHALFLARKQGYLLRAQEAERELRALGEKIDDS